MCRVPIIKCSLLPNRKSAKSWRADISLGTGNGIRALEFIAQYTRAMQPLRPLVLVLKALLKVGSLQSCRSASHSTNAWALALSTASRFFCHQVYT